MNQEINIEIILDEADDLLASYLFDQAIDKYNYILEHDSNCADALLMRGATLGEQGHTDKAIADIERSITIDNSNDSAYLTLAYLYKKTDNHYKVVELIQSALELNAGNSEAINLLIQSCLKSGDELLDKYLFDAAEYFFDTALKFNSDNAEILSGRALAAQGKGKLKECLEYSERAAQIDGSNVRNKAHIASLYEMLGEIDKGKELIQELYQENSSNPFVCIVFAQLALRTGDQDKGISVLENMLNTKKAQKSDLIDANWLLGNLYDSVKQYDTAFKYYKQSKELTRDNYDSSVYKAYISHLITYFSEEKYSQIPESGHAGETLIFVVGMPRSGTSLIENILSSHSDVFGAGELTHVYNMVDTIQVEEFNSDYPQCLDAAKSEIMNKIAGKLQSKILNEKNDETDSTRVIDKMPHNFHHIGLLHKLFPKAKFINCVRDPRDNCLSCYFQNFIGHHPYVNDLRTLGIHYLEYERLMNHWSNKLNIPILTVNYESIVNNLKCETNKMLNFLELDWEENCLEFYNQKRKVTTASYNQANKKIYNSSVGRWKNYEKYISELLEVLDKQTTQLEV